MRAYQSASLLLAVLMTAVGVAMVVSTVARGGGPLATGVILGVLLTAFGVLRGYLQIKTRSLRDG